MTRQLTWLGALGVAAITVLGACGGGSSPSAQVASLAGGQNGTSTTTTSAPPSEADTQQAMLDFAKCMREHGIDMPDPTFDENGGASFSAGSNGSPADQAKLDDAQKACQSYLDKVKSNAPPMDPAKVEEEKQKQLAFAQCMRDHGIDFPDPQVSSNGGGIEVQQPGSGVDPNSPGFKEASDTCSAQVGLPKPGE
ncbi:MAG TPA: hypothetical protein VKD67_05800, partial [Acidimicrobiales bacterium]|nr:hypothetical protein [Acidimicrobiales bacterium]